MDPRFPELRKRLLVAAAASAALGIFIAPLSMHFHGPPPAPSDPVEPSALLGYMFIGLAVILGLMSVLLPARILKTHLTCPGCGAAVSAFQIDRRTGAKRCEECGLEFEAGTRVQRLAAACCAVFTAGGLYIPLIRSAARSLRADAPTAFILSLPIFVTLALAIHGLILATFLARNRRTGVDR